jgi:sodium/hydrogen antiporter
MAFIAIFILLIFIYSLVSRRLDRTVVTAPMIFAAAGFLISFFPVVRQELIMDKKPFLLLAEVGLVMTLFTDASRIDLGILKANKNLPVRLLSTGMLLTILLGALGALVIFRQLSIWEAGILAAILAPTDAGLGQVIVNSPKLPVRIRQSLNVEAGLNDGLSVPFLMFFIAVVVTGTSGAGSVLTKFLFEQLGLGVAVGVLIGLTGGYLLGWTKRKEWMSGSLQQLGLVALPFLCLIASEPLGASMFIAAFAGGIAVQPGFKDAGRHSIDFTEGWGQLLDFFVFFLFGLIFAISWKDFEFSMVLYAVLSLTVIRMLPVAIALLGTKLSRYTILFMGWFGPRGLASIVLGLVYLEQESHTPGEGTIRLVVMMTVMLSIFAHGISTLPGINLYSRKLNQLGTDIAEYQET